MPGYIPNRDADFTVWFGNYATYAGAHGPALGLTAGQVTEINTASTDWSAALVAHNAAQDAAQAARAAKDGQRGLAEGVVRLYTGLIQKRKETTDEQRRALGITVPDREPTPLDPNAILSVPPPILKLDSGNPRVVIVHFGPNPSDERRNPKPDICGGARIWWVSGAAPPGVPSGVDDLAWLWLTDDSNSPYQHNVGRAMTVSYRAQWFDRLFHLGPLGDPVTCAVTG
jgi:hypothetical protein